MFKIQDGRKSFTQWDLNRKIIVEDDSITKVHFTNSNRIGKNALVCEVIDNVVNVPNIILQDYGTIFVYGCDSNYTKYIEAFDIIRREKPDDYIYTETEVLNYNNLLGRLDNLEGNLDKIIADYLLKNPPQVDLSNYFTKEEANSKCATKEEIPSTTGLATQQYVNEAITNSGFQTETQVNTLISNAISAIGVAEGGTY